MKTKNLVLRIFTIIFSALMFVPMVTDFITVTRTYEKSNTTASTGLKLSDLTNEYLKGFEMESLMRIGKVLFYVTFAIAMVLVVLEIVRLVTKKIEVIDKLTKICAILVLVLSIVTFALTFIWGIANGGTFFGVRCNYWPWVGGVLTLVFGVVAGICGLKDLKEKSKK